MAELERSDAERQINILHEEYRSLATRPTAGVDPPATGGYREARCFFLWWWWCGGGGGEGCPPTWTVSRRLLAGAKG